jgi:hypothetical protein
METLRWSREDRTGFCGLIADGDHKVKRLIQKLRHGFRALPAHVNAAFAHHRYR